MPAAGRPEHGTRSGSGTSGRRQHRSQTGARSYGRNDGHYRERSAEYRDADENHYAREGRNPNYQNGHELYRDDKRNRFSDAGRSRTYADDRTDHNCSRKRTRYPDAEKRREKENCSRRTVEVVDSRHDRDEENSPSDITHATLDEEKKKYHHPIMIGENFLENLIKRNERKYGKELLDEDEQEGGGSDWEELDGDGGDSSDDSDEDDDLLRFVRSVRDRDREPSGSSDYNHQLERGGSDGTSSSERVLSRSRFSRPPEGGKMSPRDKRPRLLQVCTINSNPSSRDEQRSRLYTREHQAMDGAAGASESGTCFQHRGVFVAGGRNQDGEIFNSDPDGTLQDFLFHDGLQIGAGCVDEEVFGEEGCVAADAVSSPSGGRTTSSSCSGHLQCSKKVVFRTGQVIFSERPAILLESEQRDRTQCDSDEQFERVRRRNADRELTQLDRLWSGLPVEQQRRLNRLSVNGPQNIQAWLPHFQQLEPTIEATLVEAVAGKGAGGSRDYIPTPKDDAPKEVQVEVPLPDTIADLLEEATVESCLEKQRTVSTEATSNSIASSSCEREEVQELEVGPRAREVQARRWLRSQIPAYTAARDWLRTRARAAIFSTNAAAVGAPWLRLQDDNEDRSESYPAFEQGQKKGLFPFYSYTNHSCAPNAAYRWNVVGEELEMVAIRDIAEGEEITHCYETDLVVAPFAERDRRLKTTYAPAFPFAMKDAEGYGRCSEARDDKDDNHENDKEQPPGSAFFSFSQGCRCALCTEFRAGSGVEAERNRVEMTALEAAIDSQEEEMRKLWEEVLEPVLSSRKEEEVSLAGLPLEKDERLPEKTAENVERLLHLYRREGLGFLRRANGLRLQFTVEVLRAAFRQFAKKLRLVRRDAGVWGDCGSEKADRSLKDKGSSNEFKKLIEGTSEKAGFDEDDVEEKEAARRIRTLAEEFRDCVLCDFAGGDEEDDTVIELNQIASACKSSDHWWQFWECLNGMDIFLNGQ